MWFNLPIPHNKWNKTIIVHKWCLTFILSVYSSNTKSTFYIFPVRITSSPCRHLNIWKINTYCNSQVIISNNINEDASRKWTIYNSHVISPSGCQTVGCTFSTTITEVSSSLVSINVEAKTRLSLLCSGYFNSALQGEPFLFSLSRGYMFNMFCVACFYALDVSQRTAELVDIVIWVVAFKVLHSLFLIKLDEVQSSEQNRREYVK